MTLEQAERFLEGVREEFQTFAFELSKLNRTFIIANWEAEHDVPDSDYWPWFITFLQARVDGIAAGREQARKAGFPARVSTAFEFVIVPGFEGKPSGLVEIGARLQGLDYLSYSSWWSVGVDFDAQKMEKSFRHAIGLIRNFAEKVGLPRHLIIGEFGEYWNLYPTAERLKVIIEVSIEEGVDYLFNWVLYQQPGEIGEWGRDASHFGKFFLDRMLTPQGKIFQEWFSKCPLPAL